MRIFAVDEGIGSIRALDGRHDTIESRYLTKAIIPLQS